MHVLRDMAELRKSVLFLRVDSERGFGAGDVIDVWWGGLQANGGLMMLLAYLLQTSGEWQGAEMHVKLVVGSEAAAEGARRNLEGVLGRMRITAETHVMIDAGRSFPEVLRESSRDASTTTTNDNAATRNISPR